MEKEKKTYRGTETDFVLQWGSKKRLRCVKLKKDQSLANKSKPSDALPKKKLSSRFATAEKESSSRLPKIKWMKFVDHKFYPKNQASHSIRCSFVNALHDRKSSVLSPEKEDRYYTTRGSLGLDDNGKVLMDNFKEDKGLVWPKLVLSLSSKEKEEDFMAMKGCKPPQRPKKRAKLIQRTILLVSPGAWLSDLCQERYEVREKKSSKKRPSGLKAMGSMESNSE